MKPSPRLQMPLVCLLLLCLVAAVPLTGAARAADQPELPAQAQALLQRFNEARANPRAAMTRLGIPEAMARAALGQDAWILDRGLSPLVWQEQLHLSALAHGRDMFAKTYYGYSSQDGRTPQQRIAAVDYQAAQAAEALSALAFSSYLAPEAAAVSICDAILWDELAGVPGVRRTIFSPEYSEIGIALLAGTKPLFPGRPHAYLLVADLARPVAPNQADLHDHAWLLWQRINVARANPRATMSRLGIGEATVRAALGPEAWILDQGLPPLAWNDLLHAAALGRGMRLAGNFMRPGEYAESRLPLDRIGATGYQGVRAAEATGIKIQDRELVVAAEIDGALARMLDTMLREELSTAGVGGRKIFSPDYSEIGISPLEISVALRPEAKAQETGWPDVYLLACDFAQPQASRNFVVGQAGAAAALTVLHHDTGRREPVALLPSGGFQFALPEGVFALSSVDGRGNTLAGPLVMAPALGRNAWVDF